MKTLKFAPNLIDKIISTEKTSTWRLFDDKDLKEGDNLNFINKETNKSFGSAIINSVKISKLGLLDTEDWVGHEKFDSDEEMYKTYRRYYGDRVNNTTEVKIIFFTFTR